MKTEEVEQCILKHWEMSPKKDEIIKVKRSGLFENQQGFTDKITVKEQNFPKLSKAQQNHQVFLVTLFKLVWLMKISCRGEGADYPIIKFETISKKEEKTPKIKQSKRLKGLRSAAPRKHTKYWRSLGAPAQLVPLANGHPISYFRKQCPKRHLRTGVSVSSAKNKSSIWKNYFHMQFHKARAVGQPYLLTMFRRRRLTKAGPKPVW